MSLGDVKKENVPIEHDREDKKLNRISIFYACHPPFLVVTSADTFLVYT